MRKERCELANRKSHFGSTPFWLKGQMVACLFAVNGVELVSSRFLMVSSLSWASCFDDVWEEWSDVLACRAVRTKQKRVEWLEGKDSFKNVLTSMLQKMSSSFTHSNRAPTPAASYAASASVVEYIAPAVFYVTLALVVECTIPAASYFDPVLVAEYIAAAAFASTPLQSQGNTRGRGDPQGTNQTTHE